MSLHPDNTRENRLRRPCVFFYVQHLLGTGHVKRAALLTNAMRKMGMDVHMVNGGIPTTDLHKAPPEIQLPPLRAKDQSFKILVNEGGREIDAQWKEQRCRILLDHYRRVEPDVVVIETYPFGRRQLRFELVPFLEEIHSSTKRPIVVCSVRDIVQARSRTRLVETRDILRTRFDHILVHGDPAFVQFDESYPCAEQMGQQLHYTGYVATPWPPADSPHGHNEVLVSGGGGAVSTALLAAAIKARPLSRLRASRWRVLAGPNVPERVFDTLKKDAGDGVIIERNRDDFAAMLRNCTLSVSQCGYNTVIDLIQSAVRSVVVPFAGAGETEQSLRARKLALHGIAEVLTEGALTPGALAGAIDRCSAQPHPQHRPTLDLDGASRSAQFVLDCWQRHTHG